MLKVVKPPKPTVEDRQKKFLRDCKIARTRAALVRNQLLKAYEILERIRFDYIGDSDFRRKIVEAKRGIEEAIDDFLLHDEYWYNRIREMSDLEKFIEWENQPKSGQGVGLIGADKK